MKYIETQTPKMADATAQGTDGIGNRMQEEACSV